MPLKRAPSGYASGDHRRWGGGDQGEGEVKAPTPLHIHKLEAGRS
jgi:hypothetical protein